MFKPITPCAVATVPDEESLSSILVGPLQVLEAALRCIKLESFRLSVTMVYRMLIVQRDVCFLGEKKKSCYSHKYFCD